MSTRFPTDRHSTWRLRFLEIARQVEGIGARPAASGLRPRSKMAGFATLRRTARTPGFARAA